MPGENPKINLLLFMF